MHLEATSRFIRDYKRLPTEIQRQVKETLRRLEDNPAHPSLHHKKMEGYPDVYEVRVSFQHRITYRREGNVGYLNGWVLMTSCGILRSRYEITD